MIIYILYYTHECYVTVFSILYDINILCQKLECVRDWFNYYFYYIHISYKFIHIEYINI